MDSVGGCKSSSRKRNRLVYILQLYGRLLTGSFMHTFRVRKALEMDELSQRMRSLEQDNASLHSHVDSRNAEIAHLRTVIQGLHSPSGNCLPALPPPDNPPPFGLPNPDEVCSLLFPDMATKSFIMHGV